MNNLTDVKTDKIQKAYDKMLEARSYKDDMTPQEIIKNWDQKFANEVKNRYYDIADNIGTLVMLLAHETAFSKDYQNAKAALKAFNKMDLGKYI